MFPEPSSCKACTANQVLQQSFHASHADFPEDGCCRLPNKYADLLCACRS